MLYQRHHQASYNAHKMKRKYLNSPAAHIMIPRSKMLQFPWSHNNDDKSEVHNPRIPVKFCLWNKQTAVLC